MRVILDLLPSATNHVAGTVMAQGTNAQLRFDGWLELMRLLETIKPTPADFAEPSNPSDPWPDAPTALSNGWPAKQVDGP
jgi:hypothetical protein